MADYKHEFYDGGYSALDSEAPLGRMNPANLGFPGSARTADQVKEAVNAIKQGITAFEVTMVSPDVAQAIPKEQFEELRALTKLTGVKPSVHGPIVDPAGFGERGWSEDNRENNERLMLDTIEKAHALDPKEGVPVVFHVAAAAPPSVWKPTEKGKIRETGAVVNRETGQVLEVKRKEKFYPGYLARKGGGEVYEVDRVIESQNVTQWEDELNKAATQKKMVDETFREIFAPSTNQRAARAVELLSARNPKEYQEKLRENPDIAGAINKAEILLSNNEATINHMYDQLYKYGGKNVKKKLKEFAEQIEKEKERIYKQEVKKGLNPLDLLKINSDIQDRYLEGIRSIAAQEREVPKVYEDVEEFGKEKAAETFSNVALKSYERFGKSAPKVAIETMYDSWAFSDPESFIGVVKESRKKFAEKLVKEKHISKEEAKKIAEEKIGVTLDVGHLNVMRRRGFTEKDVVKAVKKISPYVRHLHLTDNFGFNDSHLAPGMGNVPFKEILKELEKQGRLDDMRKIVEAPNVVQHLKRSPHPMTLSAFNSPIFGMKSSSYWNNADSLFGEYFAGYGNINPPRHHELYGAGFSGLPLEIGGMMGARSERSQFSNTPMT